jgi:superfamily II DNA or RNA helicase
MQFKRYQQNAIDTLKEYMTLLTKPNLNAGLAFHKLTEGVYNPRYGAVPFVCIKIPTGGGKTLVACKSVEEIMNGILQYKSEIGIVMWFVPSDAIKTQTLRKLNDPHDPHSKLLTEAFNGKIKIFSNEEALAITPEDVRGNLCVIVASLAAFRHKEAKQDKYKVYQENGSLMDHFVNLKEAQESLLEKDKEGSVVNSLVNVIRKHTPLIVIDEGHRTSGELSIEFLSELRPSFVVEFTATPREGSNVLVDTSASELKTEEMVKIPIVLQSRTQWEQAVTDGIEKQKDLERRANKLKGEYIRPIVLLQAQPKSKVRETVTVDALKKLLLDKKIPEEQIKIKTGDLDELGDTDLFNKDCKVKYIITVNALNEGWDCSFAYVLVSVANLGAKIAVEQIIGRVIRMPNAKKKKDEALNRSYVFASAPNFNAAAKQVKDGLQDNGYTEADIINADEKEEQPDPYTSHKQRGKKLQVPMLAMSGHMLAFEDLVEDMELAKANADFDFSIHIDLEGNATIDIDEDNEWLTGNQLTLPLLYLEGEHSVEELSSWLDKKLRFTELNPRDKAVFITKAIELQIKKHKHTLPELSVNRYLFAARLKATIEDQLSVHAKKVFDGLLTKGKITLARSDMYPTTIILKSPVGKVFNKNLYDRIDTINGEERAFVERLDLGALDNIEFWVRNREKVDPFYIQGWRKGKFYPDFVAVTKKGNIVALEWKGEDRISNEDTASKVEVAEEWQKLGKGKLHFFLVHNGNVDEVLSSLKSL